MPLLHQPKQYQHEHAATDFYIFCYAEVLRTETPREDRMWKTGGTEPIG